MWALVSDRMRRHLDRGKRLVKRRCDLEQDRVCPFEGKDTMIETEEFDHGSD